MSIPEFLLNASGQWTTRRSKLMMHGHPDHSSASTLEVSPALMGTHVVMKYSWEFEGAAQEGVLLLGNQKGSAAAIWVDTFHTNSAFMTLRGEIAPFKITLLGKYTAPPGPDWGWRIEISGEDGQLKFLMTNISPDGQEEPAVEAAYKRS